VLKENARPRTSPAQSPQPPHQPCPEPEPPPRARAPAQSPSPRPEPDGSGGTHAGLSAGFGDHGVVLGVDVGARPDLDQQVPLKADDEVAALAGLSPPAGDCRIDHDQIGPGYAVPTDSCHQALELAARLEGVILDPVYTGKARAGLIQARRDGRIGAATRPVFWHTGGLPALFARAYADLVRTGTTLWKT
jgi:1-aminocyclopropane-1-carboxylate deaminase/D-cysteine desulfhydrase-like pyridoxal-dependent ACC family enzyme